MNIIVACECSGVVRDAFIAKGHNAVSCDLKPTERPGPHLQCDVRTLDFSIYDLAICFPDCTHLAVSGASHFEKKRIDGRQKEGIEFFMFFTDLPCPRSSIENPVGIMSTLYRKPDQIIQPFYFGDPYQKTTCLWLKGLPKLFHAKAPDLFNDAVTHTEPGPVKVWRSGGRMTAWFSDAKSKGAVEAARIRSRTFPGIAAAMADQWG